MNINIRRCMVSDAKTIHQLCVTDLGYDFPADQIEANVRTLMGETTTLLLVAEDGDRVVGFVHAHNHNPVYAPPMKSIVAIAIDPEYRRLGLGQKLVHAVEDWARETGAHGVRVNSGQAQDEALHFYKNLGYEYIKTQYNFRKMF